MTINMDDVCLVVTVGRDGIADATSNGLGKHEAAFYLRAIADTWSAEAEAAGEVSTIPDDINILSARSEADLADKMDAAGLLRPNTNDS